MKRIDEHVSAVHALAFSPDGEALVSGSSDGVVMVTDGFGASRLLFEPGPKPAAIHGLVWLPGGAIAIGHERGWDQYEHSAEGWMLGGASSLAPTNALAALDHKTLAVGLGEWAKPTAGAFELFDLESGRRREPFFREPYGVLAVAACPGKNLVAWATGHKEVKVWDVRRQTPLRFPLTRTSRAIALAPDGAFLAATQDWAASLFDLASRQERAILKGHKGVVSAIAISPDGATVATGSWDKTVRLWESASGRERAAYEWPIGKACSLAFAPDGLRLAAGGDRGAVVLWDVD